MAPRKKTTRKKTTRRKAPARKKKSKSRVNEAGNYTKPTMRKKLFNRIKAGGKGGKPGQWSARKAQMLASAYKKAGGGYRDWVKHGPHINRFGRHCFSPEVCRFY